ncbi:hypothetical protein ZIOFF_065668 [Zingiber officinale]|uniref:Uncharacterized protein n=1 Tax=Zingiber officinale TaxID=94328 RepID=A0A8J5F0F2_ZINOF|nr:hypothetical protein ZIOFF_065668 [Zingiber officinale]
MAGFVQNLDDGELWLPSELIVDVGLSRYRHCSGAFSGARVLHESEVECLATNLLPFGTLDRLHLRLAVKQPLAVPPPFEDFTRVGPLGWFGASEREIWAGPCPQETQSGLRVLSSPGAYRGRVASGFLGEMFWSHPAAPVQLQGIPEAAASGSKPLLRSAGCAGKTEVRRNRCVSSACEGTGERIHRRASKTEINKKPINEEADESISVSLRGGSPTGMDLLRAQWWQRVAFQFVSVFPSSCLWGLGLNEGDGRKWNELNASILGNTTDESNLCWEIPRNTAKALLGSASVDQLLL